MRGGRWMLPDRGADGAAARACLRSRPAALPALRRGETRDRRGDPRAAGHREDPHSPGSGRAAPAPRPGARRDAPGCRDRARRRKPIATACNVRPQPGGHCAPCRWEMPHIRSHPEIPAWAATCECLEPCRLDGHAHPEAPLFATSAVSKPGPEALPGQVRGRLAGRASAASLPCHVAYCLTPLQHDTSPSQSSRFSLVGGNESPSRMSVPHVPRNSVASSSNCTIIPPLPALSCQVH